MSRPLRVEYAGAIYHVTVRGNGGRDIFEDDADRRIIYSRLEKCVALHNMRVFLFCLMDNHFHLVVETAGANLGRFMQSFLTSYTVCYNLRHHSHGHLTQGRYGARLVSGDEYLLKLSRYVHLNPVKVTTWAKKPLRERLDHIRDYRWSSYQGYVGLSRKLPWVDYEPMLALVGGRDKAVSYRQFVETGVAEDDGEFLEAMSLSARSIGSSEFRAWVDERHGAALKKCRRPEDIAFRERQGPAVSPELILTAVAKLAETSIANLKIPQQKNWVWRGVAARFLVKYAGLTRRAVAPLIGVKGGSAVGYQIAQVEDRLRTDERLAKLGSRLEDKWATQ